MKRSIFGSFKESTEDLYVKPLGGRRFHVLKVEHTEEWGDNAQEEYGKYHVSLSEIDLSAFDWALVCDVLRSCGWKLVAHEDTGLPAILCLYDGTYVAKFPHVDACLVEAAHGYGAKAPLWDSSGNNLRKLVREAIRDSTYLCRDVDAHEERYENTPVNKIGSSARNYMLGHLFTADKTEARKLASITGV